LLDTLRKIHLNLVTSHGVGKYHNKSSFTGSKAIKSISIGAPKMVAGRAVLGAPAGPPKIFGLGSHTGGPKTPAPKNMNLNNL
jgi:hypothetical protein